MASTIDEAGIRAVIIEAIGEHACLREARESGLYVVRQRDRAIEMAMPLAPRLAKKLIKVPWTSRVQYEDLEQAALEGIVEGIDSFDPARTYRTKIKGRVVVRHVLPSSHLFWRIRKRVYMEVQETHWLLAKPSRDDIEAYMQDAMTEGERIAYINAVLKPAGDVENPSSGAPTMVHSDGMSAVAYAHRQELHH